MNVRAKFMLTKHIHDAWSNGDSHEFVFTPQHDPERHNHSYPVVSPSGTMTIRVNNLPVIEFWKDKMGKQFYLDLTPAAE